MRSRILQRAQQNYPFSLNHLAIPAAPLEQSLLFKRLGTDNVGKSKKDPPGGGPKMRVNATGWQLPATQVAGINPICQAWSAIINLMHDHIVNFDVVI